MNRLVLPGLLCLALDAGAAPNTKNLAKEAQQLEQSASEETDPQKATELRRRSCEKWQETYDSEKKPDYLLAVALCRAKVQELDAAEKAFRLFLVQAPTDHKGRPAAEQSLERIVAERQAADNTPSALVINEPLPTEDSPHQWRKRLWLAGGSLGAAGIVAGVVAFGVLRAQDEFSRGTVILVEQ